MDTSLTHSVHSLSFPHGRTKHLIAGLQRCAPDRKLERVELLVFSTACAIFQDRRSTSITAVRLNDDGEELLELFGLGRHRSVRRILE